MNGASYIRTRVRLEIQVSKDKTTENSKPPPPLLDLADIDESEVQTGDEKELYPNFPVNGMDGL